MSFLAVIDYRELSQQWVLIFIHAILNFSIIQNVCYYSEIDSLLRDYFFLDKSTPLASMVSFVVRILVPHLVLSFLFEMQYTYMIKQWIL